MPHQDYPPIILLTGPTASGKTPLAISLAQHLPCEIISVDSAMVYRGMDIGTAKPDKATQQIAPHRLIDIRDPSEAYSAGDFRRDALIAMNEIIAKGKIPLLVGGTMLYFRSLLAGLASLPQANAEIRDHLQREANLKGWEFLHQQLNLVDPEAAARIHPNDKQRIQRALEVFLVSGKNMTAWHREAQAPLAGFQVHAFAIIPERHILHERIALRFEQMLALGFEEEVKCLYERGDLTPETTSMRSVGYRQMWGYLAGEINLAALREQTVAATRQLAKRQLTWLRSWSTLTSCQSAEEIMEAIAKINHPTM